MANPLTIFVKFWFQLGLQVTCFKSVSIGLIATDEIEILHHILNLWHWNISFFYAARTLTRTFLMIPFLIIFMLQIVNIFQLNSWMSLIMKAKIKKYILKVNVRSFNRNFDKFKLLFRHQKIYSNVLILIEN